MSVVRTIMFDKEARVTAVLFTKPTLTCPDMTKMFFKYKVIHIIYPYGIFLAALFDWMCICTDVNMDATEVSMFGLT